VTTTSGFRLTSLGLVKGLVPAFLYISIKEYFLECERGDRERGRANNVEGVITRFAINEKLLPISHSLHGGLRHSGRSVRLTNSVSVGCGPFAVLFKIRLASETGPIFCMRTL
jgi:hypothetical protein